MITQKRPRGVETDAALDDSWHRSSYPSSPDSQVRCELHGVHLVHKFPARCPLATVNPLATLGALRDLGFRELGNLSSGQCELPEALHVLAVADVCSRCLDSALLSRTVRRLRAAMGLAA